jgi:hypothetical protein
MLESDLPPLRNLKYIRKSYLNVELILKSCCLVVLSFLVLQGQLMKKISLFYTCQFSFLPRLRESLTNPP